MKKQFVILSVLALLLSGCVTTQPQEVTGPSADPSISLHEDMFSNRDLKQDYDPTDAITITLQGVTATGGAGVTVSESTVTITEEGTYILKGELSNGMIIVDADKSHKIQLVLDGVSIHYPSSAPIYIKQADKVFITLAEGSDNTISCSEYFAAIDDNNIDAALYSRDDLTLNGNGSLTVISPYGHGISSKDDLVITGGRYTINCANHGLDANDSIRIAAPCLNITAGKDGIHAENDEDPQLGYVYIENGDHDISAEGDGISASAWLQIRGGSYQVITGGGSLGQATQSGFYSEENTSIKGMKAAGNLEITDGEFSIDSADDAIHSNANVTLAEGKFTLSSGDDGIHADHTLTISGGNLTIKESYEGLEAQHILIHGGQIHLTSSDDGINAAGGADSSGFGGSGEYEQFGNGGFNESSDGRIEITGGTIYTNASGDGIDANGDLTISGGHVTVCGPTTGDTSVLDFDHNGKITGGTFIGTGSQMMARTFTESTQGVIAIETGNQTAGTQILIRDSEGNELISCQPALDYQLLVVSCPEMVKGQIYTVTIGKTEMEFTAS